MIHDTVNDGLGLVLPLQTHDKFTAGYPTGKQSYYIIRDMHTCPYMHTYLHINSLTHHSLMITNRDVDIIGITRCPKSYLSQLKTCQLLISCTAVCIGKFGGFDFKRDVFLSIVFT